MSNFFLTLEPIAGADIENCSRDAVDIANKLNISILFDFNQVKCMACPGDDHQKLAAACLAHIKKEPLTNPFHRIATGH